MGTRSATIGLVCLALLLALAGVRSATSEATAIDLLLNFVLSCGMAIICVADSRRIGRPMPAVAHIAILFAWPMAVPIYLVWSRGWKRGLLGAGAFLLSATALFMVPFFVAGYAVWGDAFFRTG